MRFAAVVAILGIAPAGAAADLQVQVGDARGGAVSDAVVYAIPEGKKPLPPPRPAVIDQKNRMFVPHVLPIQTGAAVTFPNSDNVRHQVYSFSAAKRFQLPLYAGTPAAPIVFDKPGVVILGCNIHDQMSAYVVVVDTPYFALTVNGRADLTSLPEGPYAVHVWLERMRNEPAPQRVSLIGGERSDLAFQLGTK